MTPTLSLDIETYSGTDLLKAGVYKYTEDPEFEVLMIAYAFDDEPVDIVDLASGFDDVPERLEKALTDARILKKAANANFERTCLSKHLNVRMDPRQWRCTLVDASTVGLPGYLDGIAKALKLDVQKDAAGKALIRYSSLPCKPTKANEGRTRNYPHHDQEKWQKFLDYCVQDVEVERAISKHIEKYMQIGSPNDRFEQALWALDQEIVDRGVLIDRDLVVKAISIYEEYTKRLTERLKTVTGLSNPNSVQQLTGWLAKMGVTVDNLRKDTVSELLEDDSLEKEVREVLEARQELSMSSVKKYMAMLEAICEDDRARGILQFYGAGRTGRWAGRIIQPQNLPRASLEYKDHLKEEAYDTARKALRTGDTEWFEMLYGNIPYSLAAMIRTMIIAPPGKVLAVSDFSAIEARVIAWLAGEKWRLEVFATHGKIYEASAAQMFKVPIESIDKGNPLRQKGKVAELACIAEGELVLADKGLVPIEDITLSHKVWDGENFVQHEGVIFKGIKEVITYEGLTATTDHLVWCAGRNEPIRFGDAAQMGLCLAKSGNGRRAVRLDRNYLPVETVQGYLERPESIRKVHRMRKRKMVLLSQLKKWKVEWLPSLFATSKSTEVARQKIHCCKTALHESARQELQKLWSTWNRVQVRFSFAGVSLDGGTQRTTRQKDGDRSHRREWTLRAGKPTLGNSSRELSEPKKVYDILNAGPNHRFTVSNCLVHNCGYQGGPGALVQMGALEMGLKEEDLPGIIKAWRRANPKIVKLWYDCENAAIEAIESNEKVRIQHGVSFFYRNRALYIELPSGRRLVYFNARLEKHKSFDKVSIVYDGIDSMTKQWKKLNTYGGKLVENIIQAIARDCLAHAMMNIAQLKDEGYDFPIVMHVHDEIVAETEPGMLAVMEEVMGEEIPWAPGLTLGADGFETVYYKKD